jgi:hypothetical protein
MRFDAETWRRGENTERKAKAKEARRKRRGETEK